MSQDSRVVQPTATQASEIVSPSAGAAGGGWATALDVTFADEAATDLKALGDGAQTINLGGVDVSTYLRDTALSTAFSYGGSANLTNVKNGTGARWGLRLDDLIPNFTIHKTLYRVKIRYPAGWTMPNAGDMVFQILTDSNQALGAVGQQASWFIPYKVAAGDYRCRTAAATSGLYGGVWNFDPQPDPYRWYAILPQGNALIGFTSDQADPPDTADLNYIASCEYVASGATWWSLGQQWLWLGADGSNWTIQWERIIVEYIPD
jgi:hypothetical protein